MKVCAVGAHPDDVEIGCGATLARHVLSGDEVQIVHLSNGVGARAGDPGDRMEAAGHAARILGVQSLSIGPFPDQAFETGTIKAMADWILELVDWPDEWPDVVYLHHEGDLNLDHTLAARATKTAFRPKPGVKSPRLLAFEVPSTTELGSEFCPNMFHSIESAEWNRKVVALLHYGNEIPPGPHPRSLGAINALAMYRGSHCGVRLAEAFMLLREVA